MDEDQEQARSGRRCCYSRIAGARWVDRVRLTEPAVRARRSTLLYFFDFFGQSDVCEC